MSNVLRTEGPCESVNTPNDCFDRSVGPGKGMEPDAQSSSLLNSMLTARGRRRAFNHPIELSNERF